LRLDDSNTRIGDLRVKIREFVREREWEKYHNPKDLAEAVCIEAAELLQLFQWMSPEEVSTFRNDQTNVERLEEELADVLIYCLSMANAMNIDLTSAVMHKLESNRKKYPAKLYRGRTRL
jgi:dCTP diphosphatase